jgi:hypothetical protein
MTIDYDGLAQGLRDLKIDDAWDEPKTPIVCLEAATAIEDLRKEFARADAAGCGLLRRLPMRSL